MSHYPSPISYYSNVIYRQVRTGFLVTGWGKGFVGWFVVNYILIFKEGIFLKRDISLGSFLEQVALHEIVVALE
ncbi:MAG: hypothetical protein KDJ52_28110, partial [Anaerolineae bacterium]|nr:hypothetical protein [Anaerolineae bacterium]